MVSMPSVAIKGCTLPRVTIRPSRSPNAAPTASPAPLPTSSGRPAESMPAMTAPDTASTEPTLRSMPPVRMTKVMPAAITALMETCRAMLSRLLTVRNDSLRSERMTTSNAKAMTIPNRRRTLPRRARGSFRSAARLRRSDSTVHPPSRRRHDRLLGGLGAGELRGDHAFMHDEDAVTHAEDLFHLRGDYHQPQPLAILGDQADAQRDGIGGRANDHALPVQQDLPRIQRPGPKDGMGDLCLAGADQSRDPQNLTPMDDKTDVAEEPLSRQPPDVQDRAAQRHILLGEFLGQLPADQQADELVHRQLRNGVGPHALSVAQHGHAVRNLENFLQPVRDVDDPDATGPEVTDEPEQPLCFLHGQCRGWFVHHDKLGVRGERLGDLHQLLLVDREGTHSPTRIDGQPQAGEQPSGTRVHLIPVHQTRRAAWFAAQENVLGHRERRDLIQFLVDDRDPQLARLGR